MYILYASHLKEYKDYYYGPFKDMKEVTNWIGMMDPNHFSFEIKKLIRPTGNAD